MDPDRAPPRLAAFLDVAGRRALVVGAGPVAARKAAVLLRSGMQVVVVAPEACSRIGELARDGALELRPKRFEPGDLEGMDIAIAATGDPAVNAAVAACAGERRILANVADGSAPSAFTMAATVERLPVQVAVSTGGASPALARRIAALIERWLPAETGRLASAAARYRALARRRIPPR